LQHQATVAQPNNYLYTRNDSDIGLRDSDADGVPNLAYVTGTGAFDRIILDRDAINPNLVQVTVASHSNSTFTSLIQTTSYDVDLTTDTEGELLIDSSFSSDLIEIDADIAASVRIRGMLGDDHVKLKGNGGSALHSFVFDGEAGNDTITIDIQNGDALPLAGYDFIFVGGVGTDNANVIEIGGAQRSAYFVDTLSDAADISVGNGRADANAAVDDQITLRAAIQEANVASTKTYIFVPKGVSLLSVAGTGGDSQGDLDITGTLAIIGTGAGSTVIDGTGLGDRLFEVNGAGLSLDLSRVTLTGGAAGAGSGGAVRVNHGSLTLDEVSVVGNSGASGGAIRAEGNSAVKITDSVFTANASTGTGGSGGAIAATTPTSVTIGSTIFALNTAVNLYPNVAITTTGTLVNLGYNLIDNTAGAGTFFSTSAGDLIGSVTYVVTGIVDRNYSTDDQLSLREAVAAANAAAGTIWLPAWRHRLTLTAASDTPSVNDLEITGDVTIAGAGAGLSIIDATGLGVDGVGSNDRVFDVLASGELNLSRATVTGGDAGTGSGGGFRVTEATLALDEVSVVGNTAAAGGGIRASGNASELTIIGSVFTGNTATGDGGANIVSDEGSVTIGSSIFAKNTALDDIPNVGLPTTGATLMNLGNNLVDDESGAELFFDESYGDHFGSVDYVVTSVADTFDAIDNATVMSVRDAIELANNTAGTEEIWLPAWKYILTKERTTASDSPEEDVREGDLEIKDSLTIRGVDGSSVAWRAGAAADKVFELMGDYNNDGVTDDQPADVDAADYIIWQNQDGQIGSNLAADGNDDGRVNELDYDVWQGNFGKTLMLWGIS
jgi:hypothetical protein